MAVDTFSLLNEIAASPATYGFTNITGMACNPTPPLGLPQCGPANLVAPGAQSNYLFADSIHPTTGAHAIIADLVKSMIDGPNAYSTMAEVPLATRAAHIRTLDEGLRAGAGAEVGKLTAFAAGDGGKFDISSASQNLYTDSKSRTGTAGLTMRLSESSTLGLAIGQSSADATMGSLGKYRLNETTLSALGGFKSGGLYINASGSLAELRFKDIERYVRLGPATRTNRASTKGTNASASIAAGFDFQFGQLAIGPFASYTTQSVSVDGFTENAGATPMSTDLRLDDQSRTSQVSSVGVRASFSLGSWTPFARFSVEHDGKAGDRNVTATPTSVTQNISYLVPGFKPDNEWTTATIGIRGKITSQIGLAFAYSNIMSRRDIKQDGFTANLSFAF
jgi:outer membrane lipase/esterase